MRLKINEDLLEVVDGSQSTAWPGGARGDRDWFSNQGGVLAAGKPVDQVLERGRNTVVVLRGADVDAVGFLDLVCNQLHGFRNARGVLYVTIVDGHILVVDDFDGGDTVLGGQLSDVLD